MLKDSTSYTSAKYKVPFVQIALLNQVSSVTLKHVCVFALRQVTATLPYVAKLDT